MPKRVMTVRCPARHALARVELMRGRPFLSAPVSIAERSPTGPSGAILEGLKTTWGYYGDIRESAAEGDQVVTRCECGTHLIPATWILAQLHKVTARKPDAIHAPDLDPQPQTIATRLPVVPCANR